MMTDAKIKEAFGSASEHGRLWEAVCELLQRQVDLCVNNAAQPESIHATQFHAGRLNCALEARDTFQAIMREVKNPKARAGTDAGIIEED